MNAKPLTTHFLSSDHLSYFSFFKNAPAGLILADSKYRIVSLNETLIRLLSRAESYLLNHSLIDIFPNLWLYMEPQCQRALRGDETFNQELKFITDSGAQTWLVSYSPIYQGDNVSGFGILINDISDRKEIERHRELEIERISRISTTLSRINQSISLSQNREGIFEKVARILCEQGGFPMCWISLCSAESKTLKTTAYFSRVSNHSDIFLASPEESLDAISPSAIAVNTHRPYICNNVDHDVNVASWQELYQKNGYKSLAVFPVVESGNIIGVLSVCAYENDFFKDKEVALLADAIQDISFALDNLAHGKARRRAESTAKDERSFSDAMIESMPGILYFYDEQGRFIRWNQNMERVSGYSGKEISKMHPLDFFPVSERSLLEKRIDEVFKSGETMVEASFLTKDGRTIPHFFTGKRLIVDGRPCLVGIGIDVTDRKKAEDALKELNESLELKVALRTQELKTALIHAESADHLKSAFLATMSHELRTPLNSILGFTGIVLQGLAGPLTTEQSKQLGMVRTSARHLLDLINDVLDLSKIEANQLEIRPETFDLRDSIERAVSLVKPMAEKKRLPLLVVIHPSIGQWTNDRRRMEQIFINLITNAVKFTEHGQVSVTVDLIESYSNLEMSEKMPAVRMRVKDTGIGVKPEQLSLLFQPFRQLDSGLSRQHEGTGLGLAICRRLALLLGGEISATSEWALGSEFTVVVPAKGVATK